MEYSIYVNGHKFAGTEESETEKKGIKQGWSILHRSE